MRGLNLLLIHYCKLILHFVFARHTHYTERLADVFLPAFLDRQTSSFLRCTDRGGHFYSRVNASWTAKILGIEEMEDQFTI